MIEETSKKEDGPERSYVVVSEVQYGQCCSDLMFLYNTSQDVYLCDANEPFKSYRDLRDWNPKTAGMTVGRLHDLYGQLCFMAAKKDKFVSTCKRADRMLYPMNTDHGMFGIADLCRMK